MSDDEIVKTTDEAPAKIDGRSRAARAARLQAQAEVTRQIKKPPVFTDPPSSPRTADVTGARTRSDGKLEVTGRNGEVLSRTSIQAGDVFEIPQHMIPKGWSYQWNSVSIHGNTDILAEQNHDMYMNGWRPVPAERYAGSLVPKGSKGNIIRRQMILMERPEALTREARAEEVRNAHQLISDRNDALKIGGLKNNIGRGFEMSDKVSGIRMAIDKSLDVVNVNNQRDYQLDE